MPKLIDYPRTSYPGAWEIAEVVDDTGGKCALDTCARKLNRKVSGSFKAIVGSAVKFGLLTSKREMLATTTLFRRIKHAYDKQEELVFHREAFLTPPLFTQLCRKFRSRELPVAMLDVLLIREFGVEEINAQGVAKAFIDGARMVNLLDEHNVVADIDQLAAQQPPKRELASPTPGGNVFRQLPPPNASSTKTEDSAETEEAATSDYQSPAAVINSRPAHPINLPPTRPAPAATADAIATLFGFSEPGISQLINPGTSKATAVGTPANYNAAAPEGANPPTAYLATAGSANTASATIPSIPEAATGTALFRIHLAGPGLNTQLDITDPDDLTLVRALLDKIERQLKR